MEFHGIIVDKSLKDPLVIKNWNVLGQQKAGSWVLYKIGVKEDKLDTLLEEVRGNMRKGKWYAHFYNEDGSKLYVVFKNKTVDASDPEKFDEIMKIGELLEIPQEQLDFQPRSFDEEEF